MTRPLDRTGSFMVRHPWLVTLPLSLLTALSLLVAGFAYFGQAGVSDRVTTIEKSPCLEDPGSDACNDENVEQLRHQPLQTTCIPFRKALPTQILTYTRCVLPKNQKFPPNPGG